MKILVFCADLLPLPGLPTSGGGLRSWQMVCGLRSAGHHVLASMPLFTYLARRWDAAIPDDARALAWTPETQDLLVQQHQPDAVLFTSSWIASHLQQSHDCLLIYDLDGPALLESHYKGDWQCAVSVTAKVSRLAHADFVLVGGHRQRYYIWPFLMMAGFTADELSQVAVVPVTVPEAVTPRTWPDRLQLVAGGGFYPWQDPSIGLTAAAAAVRRYISEGGDARFRIRGRSHSVTGSDDRLYDQLQTTLPMPGVIELADFVPRDQLLAEYAQASLAIDLQAPNPERELAVTTRTLDYLRAGLPVVYGHAGELSEMIRQHVAGWTVDATDAAAIEGLVYSILQSPAEIKRRGECAMRMVANGFEPGQAILPLVRWLESPTKRRAKPSPALIEHQQLAEYQRVSQAWTELQQSRGYRALRRLRQWAEFLGLVKAPPAPPGATPPPSD